MGDKYKLHVVNYNTHLRKARYHQALFVETDSSAHGKRGVILEVQGPVTDLRNSLKRFVFESKVNIAPEHSQYFVSWKPIGRLKDNDLSSIYDVCDEVKPPIVPLEYQGESPNCCDWVKNVIYKLSKQDLVEFSKDYALPSREISMVSKDVSTEKGSSSKSTEKGSSSKSTEKGSSSKSTEKGSSSKSTGKSSSSKPTEKGSSSKRGSRH